MSDEENKRIKKTANINDYMNKYMKDYREKNLEIVRKRQRENYRKNKYKSILTDEEIEMFAENLEKAYMYKKEMIKNHNFLMNLLN